jgi:STE24 endopeptidase
MTDSVRARAYQKKRQILRMFELVYTPAVLLITVLFPVSLYLKSIALQTAGGQSYAAMAVYFLAYSLYMMIFDGPMAFYSGYLVEKQFGLSNHTPATWLGDFLKRIVLSFLLSLALVEGLYFLIWNYPEHWWVIAWAAFAGISYLLGKIFPVFVVPIFYKYGKVENEDLKKRIVDLSSRYGLPLENVYSLNLSRTTKKANAAFMGMGKTKRVVLSDTLLEHFSPDEIEAVVAHELGHFKHKDIWKQLAVGVTTSFIGFWIVYKTLGPAARALGFDGVGDIAALPLIFLIFYAFHLVMMPLQNGFSRVLERAADRFSLTAFPKKDAFISCMDKLAEVNLADRDPHPLVEWFFFDHPAIDKRIQMAREFQIKS